MDFRLGVFQGFVGPGGVLENIRPRLAARTDQQLELPVDATAGKAPGDGGEQRQMSYHNESIRIHKKKAPPYTLALNPKLSSKCTGPKLSRHGSRSLRST